jgi:hypothetical protein
LRRLDPNWQPSDAVNAQLLEFLRGGNRNTLVSFRLAKMAEVANLTAELVALLDQLMNAKVVVELVSLFVDPPAARAALPGGKAVSDALVRRAGVVGRRGPGGPRCLPRAGRG